MQSCSGFFQATEKWYTVAFKEKEKKIVKKRKKNCHSLLFSVRKIHVPAFLVDWFILVQIHPSAKIGVSLALC